MQAYVFLIAASILIAIGTLVVLVRHHEPKHEDNAMAAFRRELRALSPEARRATDPRLRSIRPNRDTTGE